MAMGRRPGPGSTLLAKAAQRARRLVKNPEALIQLAKDAEGKAANLTSGPRAAFVDELKALARMIRAYAKGEYRNVSWKSMLVAVGALLYLVSPIDVVPDFILGSGMLDDATVVAFAFRKIHKEVAAFLEWERASGNGSGTAREHPRT